MLIQYMLGWQKAGSKDGFTDCFVYVQCEGVLLGSIARLPENVAKEVGIAPLSWAFEFRDGAGVSQKTFFDPKITAEEMQRKAAAVLSRQIRLDVPAHGSSAIH